MRKALVIVAGLLVLVLVFYVAMGSLVYCYYEPNIELLMAEVDAEALREDGWNQAVTEIEDECRRLGGVQCRGIELQKRQRDRLQQSVKVEEIRTGHLKKSLRDQRFRSSVEWRLRTEARLVRAKQALAEFDGPRKDAKLEAQIQKLRQKLDALRIRRQEFQVLQDRLNLMIEWRDRLKIWPLPMIDRLGEEKISEEQ